ncbi:PEGA domain-containing protein [Methanospirillum hungatei]|uniref:PEGA domain-containing protein n=1 Tax=Methanospirillum hungatei TaxID=2203 RepID=UPI0009CB2EA5|nr:PEGA domain-containing protein [Methanospirillum hungatei]OQA59140.1 MAG: PEGA domain protein [Euryarchaeota archaeon ADurb.Bin294]HOW05848.1 PEGA domain-containing protein [Methanospirillum hungatei]
MRKYITQKGIFLAFICIISGISGVGYADQGDNLYYDQQGSGSAEPFYPSYVPSPDTDLTPVQDMQIITIQPGMEYVYTDPSPSPDFSPPSSSIPNQPIFSHDPVGSSYQDPGNAEPYYPSSPPSPGNTYEDPVQVVPVTTQYPDPGIAVPYYPAYPPEPEPTQYIPPREYSSPVYIPSPRYQEPVVIHTWYDDRYYRPSYYDPYDRKWEYYSYAEGTLKVSSTPYQAEIYLDNRFRGYTPYSGYRTIENLRPGTYTLRLKTAGYYDYSEDVYVSRGRTTYVDADMVRIGERYQKAGSISVQSEPPGAGVYLNNEYRGFTPVVLTGVSPDEHTLLVRKDGFIDYVSKVQVMDKQTISISAILNPAPVPATLTPVVPPVESPVPTPTKSGLFEGIVCISVLLSALFMVRHRPDP